MAVSTIKAFHRPLFSAAHLFKWYLLLVMQDYLFLLGIASFFLANKLYLRGVLAAYSDLISMAELDVTNRLRIAGGYIALSLLFLLLVGLVFINRFDSVKKLKAYQYPVIKTLRYSLLLSAFNYALLILPLSLPLALNICKLKPPQNVLAFFSIYLLLFGFSLASWHSAALVMTVSALLLVTTLSAGASLSMPQSLLSVLLIYSILPALIKALSYLLSSKTPKIVVIERLGYAPFSPYVLVITALLFLPPAVAKLALGEKLELSVNIGGVTFGVRDFDFSEETILASIAAGVFGASALFVVPPLLNVANRYIDAHMHYVKFLTSTRLSVRVLNIAVAFLFGWLYAAAIYCALHVLSLIKLEGIPVLALTTGLLAGMFTLNRVEEDFEFSKCFVLYFIMGALMGLVLGDVDSQSLLAAISIAYTALVLAVSALLYDLPVKAEYFIRYRVTPWLKRW